MIALVFAGLKRMSGCKKKHKEVKRNNVAGFSGWPKPG